MWLRQLFAEPGGEGPNVRGGEVGSIAVDEHVADDGRTRLLGARYGRRVDQAYALDVLCDAGVDLRVVESLASRGRASLQMIERARDALWYVLVRMRHLLDERYWGSWGAQLFKGGGVAFHHRLLARVSREALAVLPRPVGGEATCYDEARILFLHNA